MLIFWLCCMLVVAIIAKARGRSFIAWCVIAFLISPLLALILLLCLRNLKRLPAINITVGGTLHSAAEVQRFNRL